MKFLKLGLISLLAVLLVGCIEANQEITINKDGSGQLKSFIAIPQSTLQMMASMKEQGGGGGDMKTDIPMTEEDIRKKFANKEGIKLTDVKVEEKDGKRQLSFTAEFKSLPLLFAGAEMEELSLTKDTEGNYTLSSGSPKDKPAKTPEQEAMEKQMKMMMLPMLKGLKVSFKINTPTEIISTTATEKTTNSALWNFDVDKDPTFLDKEPELNVKFKGEGLDLPEIKGRHKTEMPPPPAQ